MRVSRGKASVSGDITVSEDLDFLGSWQVKGLASPASGEALRKGNRDIGTAEISLTANITATQIANTALTRALMTAQGDMITRNGSVPKKLVKGTAGHYLKQGANEPEWAAVAVKEIATGTYSGDNAEGRQITTGFICSFVVIIEKAGTQVWLLIPTASLHLDSGTFTDKTTPTYPHATDGFVVDQLNGDNNVNTETYYYWAIST